MLKQHLFKHIDNSQLVVFRIFFGLLMVAECWGAIATGWVKETFVDPQFTFTFFGFEWTQVLIGQNMYVVFVLLGLFAWGIALGFCYRYSAILFALGWSMVYFMQKSHYNNHYYLVVLVAWFMAVVPANKANSIDVWLWPKIKQNTMYNWVRLFVIVQVAIVYFFAAIAKIYPGWWEGKFLILRLEYSAHWFRETLGWNAFADFLALDKLAISLSWMGMFFDFLFVPFMLYKPTRNLVFFGALLFHLFNSVSLHIGIFPYFALAMCVFFYSPKYIRSLFLQSKSSLNQTELKSPILSEGKENLVASVFVIYFVWQTYLPLRHWLIPDDVLWTEEGHRLSWRMMLRTKSAVGNFYLQDKSEGKKERINLREYCSNNQIGDVKTKPDMMFTLAKRIKKEQEKLGKDVAVFVDYKLSVNGGPYHQFTKPNVDISSLEWNYFGHQSWLMPSPKSYSSFDAEHDKKLNH